MVGSFWTQETGQGLTEYAAIVALVSIALLLALVAFREEIGRIYGMIRLELMEDALQRPGRGQGAGCPSIHGCRLSGGA